MCVGVGGYERNACLFPEIGYNSMDNKLFYILNFMTMRIFINAVNYGLNCYGTNKEAQAAKQKKGTPSKYEVVLLPLFGLYRVKKKTKLSKRQPSKKYTGARRV
jgi:hypothetical protein